MSNPDRRDRSRDRRDDKQIGRNDGRFNDSFGRGGRRGRSRSRSRERRDDNDNFGRERERAKPPQSKAALEQAKKERLALVKGLTEANSDDEKDRLLKEGTEDDDETNEEAMMAILGFANFDSTKGKAVDDNHAGAALGACAKHKGRKYRQYMNRKGGFNRPLAKMD